MVCGVFRGFYRSFGAQWLAYLGGEHIGLQAPGSREWTSSTDCYGFPSASFPMLCPGSLIVKRPKLMASSPGG